MTHEERIKRIESKYWHDFVEFQKGDPVEVEYAADLETDIFGSGFSTSSDDPYTSHPWNLLNLRN